MQTAPVHFAPSPAPVSNLIIFPENPEGFQDIPGSIFHPGLIHLCGSLSSHYEKDDPQ
jgi:hypothetical protein